MELEKSYGELIHSLKQEIVAARVKAHLAVNAELIILYWKIGRHILNLQREQGWGAKVIDKIAQDLRHEFPDMKGLSSRNLVYMQTFAKAYPDFEFTQAALAKITWYHNITLLEKVSAPEVREWYIHKTIENGWSRNVLVHHIESKLYERQGKAITNFSNTLPEAQSDLAQEIFKSSYHFEFLQLEQRAKERDLEKGLINNIRDFLLELGSGVRHEVVHKSCFHSESRKPSMSLDESRGMNQELPRQCDEMLTA